MTDTDVTALVRRELEPYRSDRDVDDVLQRGRVLRARRRRPVVVAAVVAVAAAVGVGFGTVGSAPPAFADWSATPETTSDADFAAIDASCRSQLDAPVPLALAVLDRRGANAVALYTDGDRIWDCSRFRGEDADSPTAWTQGGSGGPSTTDDPDGALRIVGASAMTNVDEGSMTSVYGWVDPSVTQVVVDLPGRSVVAAVGGGTFDAWWPSVAADDVAVTVVASAADGTEVARRTTMVPGFGTG